MILDYVYDQEAAQPDKVDLTQPMGQGEVVDYTWGQTMDQARRMAAHLKGLALEPGARIAILAKNSAHFFMGELAIWMAGGTTVAIFPTETADNVRFVLDQCEARLLFIGRLDAWEQQKGAVPAGFPAWDDIVARTAPHRTAPLGGRPARRADDLAMLLYTSGSTGQPKGVMQSFGRITHAVESSIADPLLQFPEDRDWRVLSYLPLAHAYERAVVACRTLIDGRGHVFFCDSVATFTEDIKRARPTLFVSVPRLWLKFQQAIFAALPPAQLMRCSTTPRRAKPCSARCWAAWGWKIR